MPGRGKGSRKRKAALSAAKEKEIQGKKKKTQEDSEAEEEAQDSDVVSESGSIIFGSQILPSETQATPQSSEGKKGKAPIKGSLVTKRASSSASKGKGVTFRTPSPSPAPPRQREEPEDIQEVEDEDDEDEEGEDDVIESSQSQEKSSKKSDKLPKKFVNLTKEVEKDLVEWLIDNPMFYNKGLNDYRDTEKKKAEWTRKSIEIGIPPSELTRWFNSTRTQYGKLIKPVSGQAARALTERQQWIVDSFSFLNKHIHRQTSRTSINVSKYYFMSTCIVPFPNRM